MAENDWLELWPAWARRWYGMVLRILFGATGSMLGIGLIALANFGATFKSSNRSGMEKRSRSLSWAWPLSLCRKRCWLGLRV